MAIEASNGEPRSLTHRALRASRAGWSSPRHAPHTLVPSSSKSTRCDHCKNPPIRMRTRAGLLDWPWLLRVQPLCWEHPDWRGDLGGGTARDVRVACRFRRCSFDVGD